MLDHLRLQIPFDASLVVTDEEGRYGLLGVDLHDLEINLGSRCVVRDADGTIKPQVLHHPYESLPTSFTAMAFKVHLDGFYMPYVEIKASPAKLLQGHNVFGSDDIESGAFEMLGYLAEAYPTLYSMLYVQGTEVKHLDVTYSARVKDDQTVALIIDYLSRVSNGQTRKSGRKFQNSAYWGGETSRLVQHKCYGKFTEFMNQLEDYIQQARKNDKAAQRVVEVMSDPRLIEYVKGILRWESRIKSRWLERRNIPTNLFELIKYQKANPDLLQTIWKQATKSIFDALEGQTMKCTDDDSVFNQLKAKYKKVTYAKANKLYKFYEDIRDNGFEVVKQRTPENTFKGYVSDFLNCGVSEHNLITLQEAIKNKTVRFTDDEILCVLKLRFNSVSYVQPNNLFNFYCALREHGCDAMRLRFSERRYYELMADLQAAGFSKAFLQNLHSDSKNNVVPLLRFVQVDLSQQFPDWYQVPVSRYAA